MNKSGFGRTEKVGTPKQLLYTVIILISVVVIGGVRLFKILFRLHRLDPLCRAAESDA